MSAQDCIGIIRDAGGKTLTDDEVLEIAETIERRRKRLVAEDKLDNLDERLAAAAADEAGKARLAAALARKHAALNAIVRDRVDAALSAHVDSGLTYSQSVVAILEGAPKAVGGGRVSVAAEKLARESRYIGDMMADLHREKPHLIARLGDEDLNDDAVREMYELRDGGRPGITGNADAQFLAATFAGHAERARTDLNKLGAVIGKLDGWAGPQSHDPYRLLKTGRKPWIDEQMNRLDLARTFPDLIDDAGGPDLDAIRAVLDDSYTTIVTGRDNQVTAAEKGEYTGPANLAKSLSRHRVFHYKSADDWLAYNKQYGHGNLAASMHAHQARAARLAAQMQVLGPNPEVMLKAVLASHQRRLRVDPNLDDVQKMRQMEKLADDPATAIGQAFAEMQGLTLAPTDSVLARIGASIRAWQTMAKLGKAVLSTIPDPIIAAANLRYNGRPLFAAYGDTLNEVMRGRGGAERREIAFLIGEGFDGLIGQIISPYYAGDAVPGAINRAMVHFFRLSGLSGQADVMRAANARMLSAWLGRNAGDAWDALPERLRFAFGQHGIDGARWEAIRGAGVRTVDGKPYLTPEAIARLPDDVIDGLIDPDVLAAAGEAGAQRVRDRARLELELQLRAYFADEVSFGHLQVDERTRRLTLRGTRSGTFWGEAARYVMQFKGFPIAFTERVIGRAVGGHAGATPGARIMNGTIHAAHLAAGLTVAGYLAMSAKDLARGYEPRRPETPDQWMKVIAASIIQGGGAGIYGDFLFGEANRFGGGVLQTVAGPVFGEGAGAVQLWNLARQGDLKAADALNYGLRNTPFLNLFYVRPALDYLFLQGLHEGLSPGYLDRQERRREKQYGQQRLWGPRQ